MEQKDKKRGGLPENANRELKDGEKYVPILPPEQNVPEVSFYSVSVGVLMAVLFSAAAAYLGLKVGQVFEAAIPIAIIAVGLSSVSGRKNALGENVIIQSIGSASSYCCRSHFYVAGIVYFANEISRYYCQFYAGVPKFVAWRYFGNFVPYSVP